MTRLLVQVVAVSVLMTAFAEAQEINFKDLLRPGKPLRKSYTIKGVGREGDNYISRFSETDQGRVEAMERRRASYASAPPPPSSTRSEPPPPAAQKFLCSIDCDTGESTIFRNKGGEVEFEILAATRDDAVRMAIQQGDKICKGGTYRRIVGSSAYCRYQ